MAVNQQAIADRLDVSTATVSRSLRSDPAINPSTRARVLEAASRLGYQPKPRRSRKAGGNGRKQGATSSPNIGVLVSTDAQTSREVDWNNQQHLAGMCSAAQASDMAVTIHYADSDAVEEQLRNPRQRPAALNGKNLAGLALLGNFPRSALEYISQHYHCVSVGTRYEGLRVDSVDAANVPAMNELVGYLHQLGHERIGFLNGFRCQSWVQDRLAGYMSALMTQGLPVHQDCILNISGNTLQTPAEQWQRLVELREQAGMTAVICANDYAGYNQLFQARETGHDVPGFLSITGFDAIPPTFGSTQGLTSMRFPYHEMGAAIVRRIRERQLDPAGEIRHILFRCQLVVGETTGPVVK